jgi:hypothetical protein
MDHRFMEQIELDDIDLRLLEQLQKDASLSNLELASAPSRRRRPACGVSSACARPA